MTLFSPATLDCPARRRFDRNCRALGLTLPFPPVEPATGRDGSPTARRDGQWLAGCSVPRRAAEVMVRKAAWAGPTLCLLLPTHGQQIEAVLIKLGRPHGLIVRAASAEHLAELLACCNVAEAVGEGRLFVAFDDAGLRAIFAANPGLAVPQQMVRLPDADPAAVEAATVATRAVLVEVSAGQAARITAARQSTAAPTTDFCLLACQHFGLWNDAGNALAAATGLTPLDVSRPDRAALAAVAEAVPAASAVLAADVGRADRRDVARPDRPWLTWITKPRVPAFLDAQDALLLADPAFAPLARTAGWPESRVAVAGWPPSGLATTPGQPLALIADLPDTAPPPAATAASSRQVVWEAIVDELTRDPFALGADPAAYVARAPGRMNLDIPDLPTQLYLDRCVAPAVLLGTARWLAAQGIAFTIHGDGWATHDALSGHVRGPVADRAAFEAAVRTSGGLLDVFPTAAGHPVRSLGIPVVHTFGQTPQRVLQVVAAAMGDRLGTRSGATRPITLAAVRKLIAP